MHYRFEESRREQVEGQYKEVEGLPSLKMVEMVLKPEILKILLSLGRRSLMYGLHVKKSS
ncbi:MAG: hypothetical protein ACLU4J_24590 [Butyricimonas paravirosa]